MNYFIKEKEFARFKNRVPGSLQDRLYHVLKERTYYNTREDMLVQSTDTQEWYHLVWERMSDASFVYYVEKDEKLGKWVHDRTMEIVRLPIDDWYGPWFRINLRRRKAGSLETGHIALGVCEAYENARDVFTEEEQQEIRTALYEKGLVLCRNFSDEIFLGKNGFNWFMVLLNGYGTTAVVLDEKEEVEHAKELFHRFAAFYNKDSYGESVQYSNYASLHLSFLAEIFIRSGYAKPEELPLSCYGNLMAWYASSIQRMKYAETFDCVVPRTFAFGDSSNLFRPTGNVLAHVAVHLKESMPKSAGLATWLFETVYGKEEKMPDELATFGFVNQFAYHSILMYEDMASPISPKEAELPLNMRFDIGHILIRDKWEEPNMAMAIAAGYEPLGVSVHRHLDQNSFQLSIGQERMLIDPGHCCYRLHTQARSKDEISHNTISIRYKDDFIRQREVFPEAGKGEASVYNKLLVNETFQDMQVIISDGSGLYESPVQKAVRIWLVRVPDIVVVCDYVQADEPVEFITRLVANNRDNKLVMERKGNDFLTLTRKDSVLEVHQAYSTVDGMEDVTGLSFDWTYLHDYYHPIPNQDGQGKEGSALTYVWTSGKKAKEHKRVQVLIGQCNTQKHAYEVQNRNDKLYVTCDGTEVLSLMMYTDHIMVYHKGELREWSW